MKIKRHETKKKLRSQSILSKRGYSTWRVDRVETKDGGLFYSGTRSMASTRTSKVFKIEVKPANQNPDQKVSMNEEGCLRVGAKIL